MEAKLIKVLEHYHLYDGDKAIATTIVGNPMLLPNLSLKNCQAIERGYDLDELAKKYAEKADEIAKLYRGTIQGDNNSTPFKEGFQKALEILGDKKFSEEDMMQLVKSSFYAGLSKGQGKNKDFNIDDYVKEHLQQTEWDCIVEMEFNPINHASGLELTGNVLMNIAIQENYKPKLDADGCLILKRK